MFFQIRSIQTDTVEQVRAAGHNQGTFLLFQTWIFKWILIIVLHFLSFFLCSKPTNGNAADNVFIAALSPSLLPACPTPQPQTFTRAPLRFFPPPETPETSLYSPRVQLLKQTCSHISHPLQAAWSHFHPSKTPSCKKP